MSLSRPFAPGEIKILRALEHPRLGKVMPKSYKSLREETKLSDPVLSDYLKRLQKKKLIQRDIETRGYLLSVKGKRRLQLIDLVEELKDVLEEQNVNDVVFESEDMKEMVRKLASGSKKNLRIITNCLLVLHTDLVKMFPKIGKVFGPDCFIRAEKLSNGKVLLDFKEANS